jgi:DNA-binding LacI/PurR family transcriptional regulator
MSVTLEDISQATGFSVPTVPRAVPSSTYHVSVATRERILEVAEALKYRPSLSVGSLPPNEPIRSASLPTTS